MKICQLYQEGKVFEINSGKEKHIVCPLHEEDCNHATSLENACLTFCRTNGLIYRKHIIPKEVLVKVTEALLAKTRDNLFCNDLEYQQVQLKSFFPNPFPKIATEEKLKKLGAEETDASQMVYKRGGIIVGWIKESPDSDMYRLFYSGAVKRL